MNAEGNVIAQSAPKQVEYYDALQNGGFEDPVVSSGSNQPDASEVPYWNTTEKDNLIELGNARNAEDCFNTYGVGDRWWDWYYRYSTANDNDGEAGEDTWQFAELNAGSASSLYQTVLTAPDSELNWQVAHRARLRDDERDSWRNPVTEQQARDTMYVVIMSEAGAQALLNVDQSQQQARMEEMISAVLGGRDSVQHASYKIDGVVYDVSVWKQTSDATGWHTYNGTYTVPNDQYLTRFFFVSGETFYDSLPGADRDLKKTIGNLLDNVWFSPELPPPAPERGNLTVTKNVTGVTTLPADYQVTVEVTGGNGESQTGTISGFTYDAASRTWSASYTFQNLKPGTYTVRETSVTQLPDEQYRVVEKDTIRTVSVTVEESKTVTGTLVNAYWEDTSAEYPVRFYLEGISDTDQENYPIVDLWGKLPAHLSDGFAGVAYKNTATTAGQLRETLYGDAAVRAWLAATNNYLGTGSIDPNIDSSDVKAVLEQLVKDGNIRAETAVLIVGDQTYTVQDVIDQPNSFEIVYTQASNNNDGLTEYYRGNHTGKSGGGYQDWQKSYHVHLTVVKDPGSLQVTKTWSGLDSLPADFQLVISDGQRTVKTLTLDSAEITGKTATWTVDNLSEYANYTITEQNADSGTLTRITTWSVNRSEPVAGNSASLPSQKVSRPLWR